MDQQQLIYSAIIGAVILVLFIQLEPSKEPYSDVLPDVGYCLEKGINVSYTTMQFDGGIIPTEYCPLKKFCDEYIASTVFNDQEYSQSFLDQFEAEKRMLDYNCFQAEAQNTQRIVDVPQGKYLKSKYVCCVEDKIQNPGYCETNTCNGKFTGLTDKEGCRIYAVEMCKLETTCEYDKTGQKTCDPQPYNLGVCRWDTLHDYGKTYFIEISMCGLKTEEPCGTTREYCCDSTCNNPCSVTYTYKTGTYIEGCGGYRV